MEMGMGMGGSLAIAGGPPGEAAAAREPGDGAAFAATLSVRRESATLAAAMAEAMAPGVVPTVEEGTAGESNDAAMSADSGDSSSTSRRGDEGWATAARSDERALAASPRAARPIHVEPVRYAAAARATSLLDAVDAVRVFEACQSAVAAEPAAAASDEATTADAATNSDLGGRDARPRRDHDAPRPAPAQAAQRDEAERAPATAAEPRPAAHRIDKRRPDRADEHKPETVWGPVQPEWLAPSTPALPLPAITLRAPELARTEAAGIDHLVAHAGTHAAVAPSAGATSAPAAPAPTGADHAVPSDDAVAAAEVPARATRTGTDAAPALYSAAPSHPMVEQQRSARPDEVSSGAPSRLETRTVEGAARSDRRPDGVAAAQAVAATVSVKPANEDEISSALVAAAVAAPHLEGAVIASANPTDASVLTTPAELAAAIATYHAQTTDREMPLIRGHFGRERAEIVVGQGAERVSLRLAWDQQGLRVEAVVGTKTLAAALVASTNELRAALERRGITLHQFSVRGGDGAGPPEQEQHAEPPRPDATTLEDDPDRPGDEPRRTRGARSARAVA